MSDFKKVFDRFFFFFCSFQVSFCCSVFINFFEILLCALMLLCKWRLRCNMSNLLGVPVCFKPQASSECHDARREFHCWVMSSHSVYCNLLRLYAAALLLLNFSSKTRRNLYWTFLLISRYQLPQAKEHLCHCVEIPGSSCYPHSPPIYHGKSEAVLLKSKQWHCEWKSGPTIFAGPDFIKTN